MVSFFVIVPPDTARNAEAFYDLVAQQKITVLNQTPSAFRAFMQAEKAIGHRELALRYVVFGGEALDFQSLRPWFAQHGDVQPRLINMYGITETTVHTTYHCVRISDLEAQNGSTVGAAMPDLQIYLMDSVEQLSR